MRILQVRFKNLNSLVGEWKIDLTHPAFASDGIFAITGPTGSGKTTLLDAICLALYGRTPRLNKIGKSGNEIMSRQTGECFAEVTFETQPGRFCCHWSQHRARKKPDGELQPPKQEISDAGSGGIIASGIKGVAEHVETVTGMDFDRFTRSMLLAQGGFAAFLQADADERAPILEQITGTEIYSRISVRVHERLRSERESLHILYAELAGIATLEPEQEKAMRQELEMRQKEEADISAACLEAGKGIAWLKTMAGLQQELLELAEEGRTLQAAIEAFRPERDKLTRAVRAASLDGTYATLAATRKQQAEDQAELRAGKEALPQLESVAKARAEALLVLEQQTSAAKHALMAAAPLMQNIRALDQKLAEQKKTIAEGEARLAQAVAKSDNDKRLRHQALERRAGARKELERVDGYLKEHAQDAWLVSGLTGVAEQASLLHARQKEIVKKEADRRKACTALELAATSLHDVHKQCTEQKRKLAELSGAIRQGRDELELLLSGKSLREYRADKEALLRELALLTRITELEEYRAKLEHGRPCPLCGAEAHPFATGNIPTPDETEKTIATLAALISRAEAREAAIRQLEEDAFVARNRLLEIEKREAILAKDKEVAAQALVEAEEGLGAVKAEFEALKKTVLAKLLPFGIATIPDADILSLLEPLKKRLNTWQARIKTQAEIEKQLTGFNSEITRLDAVIATQSAALAQQKAHLETLAETCALWSDERKRLFGDNSPDTEEQGLNRAVFDAEAAEKSGRESYHEALQQWNTVKTQVASLEKRVTQRAAALEKQTEAFSAALGRAGFSDEGQFLEARLDIEQRNELAAKGRELDDNNADLRARHRDRELRLLAESARRVTDRSLEELEAQVQGCADILQTLRDAIAGLKHTLKEHALAKERLQSGQSALEARKRELRKWENLHELIGSADGKKYRNFAQGLTFAMMIAYANLQLQKMTDRYLLIRDAVLPLELNVTDNYQAGEIRSTKNLSGGESFIVSLSLALGLSRMASKNVRVDSLFLDEGFGTLDEESLDTALETLASLQRGGKLIGVISHIPAIKDRIATQIRITPHQGGRSLISGPGCSRLDAAQ